MYQLSPNIRRLLAISLIILPLLAIMNFILIPLRQNYLDNQNEIEEKRFLLAKYLTIQNKKVPKKTSSTSSTRKNFMEGQSETIVFANLQSTVKNIATKHQIIVQQASKIQSKKNADSQLVGVRIDLSGTQKKLYQLLHDIENHIPFLIIERASFRANEVYQPAGITSDKIISLQLEIYAGLWEGDKK